jgi:hypothetical protein
MARKETLTRNGNREPCLNIDAPVGPRKVTRVKNLHGDVMLVQAIFHVLAARVAPSYVGLATMDEVPKPTGRYDSKTEAAIQGYQTNQRSGLLRVDGVIDPASYRGRNIVSTADTPFMTMTLLHVDLRVLFDTPEYSTELTRLVPQLLPWLK